MLAPKIQSVALDALFLVVMKVVVDAVGFAPGEDLFHRCAIFYAVDDNHINQYFKVKI
jgi:hypothetical protein